MNEPRRILHVLGGLDQGGAETYVMSLYRSIDRALVQFDFVVHASRRFYYEDEIESLGGHVFRVPRFTGFNICTYGKAWHTFFRSHPGYTAVHGHIGSSAAIYLHIAKKFGLYTIAHSHGSGIGLDFKGIVYACCSYPTRFIADRFFACSLPAGISRFGKRVVSSERFKVIRNAIDVGKFNFDPQIRQEMRESLSLSGKFVVGHVGRLDPLKNHVFLLNLFKQLHMRFPDSMLLLVGDGDERTRIEHTIERLGLHESVILLGARSDIPELLATMDVFVFPSTSEGLGISLIEAQATGLPCIASTAVPREAKITDLVEFISLNEPVEQWVDAIVSHTRNNTRVDHISSLREHGYDVTVNGREMQEWYQRLCVLPPQLPKDSLC